MVRPPRPTSTDAPSAASSALPLSPISSTLYGSSASSAQASVSPPSHPRTICPPLTLRAIAFSKARIVKEGQIFRRWEVGETEAWAELAEEPYKVELIGLKGRADEAAEGASVEVGLGGLTIYQNPVSYTHLRAHETDSYLVCRLLLE